MAPFHRIAIFTASGAYNLWDEVIVRAEYDFLRRRYPNAKIRVATYDPKSHLLPEDDPNLAYFRHFPCGLKKRPFANVQFFLQNFVEIALSDLVIIGGGGLFYDNESGQSFRKQLVEWNIRVGLAKLFRKKVFFWGVGVDVRPENAQALNGIFRSAAKVTVRDQKSAEILSGIGIPATVIPDPAFLLQISPRSKNLPVPPKIGISFRKGYLKGELESVRSIVQTLRENGCTPVFLNHSFHSENLETNDANVVSGVALEEGIASTQSLQESFAMYQELSAVIAMRLHAGFLSFAQGIPCILLSYSEKTEAFSKMRNSPWHLQASEFRAENFQKTFLNFIQTFGPLAFFARSEKYDTLKEEARISSEQAFYGLESIKR